MAQQSEETLIKRYESCAETYKKKGDREYAYAKNGLGDEHYGKAKFEKDKCQILLRRGRKFMSSPKLEGIIRQLDAGETFSMTNSQYKKSTGLNIPKDTNYLIKRSAVAQKARERGYKIVVHEREISFEKENTNG